MVKYGRLATTFLFGLLAELVVVQFWIIRRLQNRIESVFRVSRKVSPLNGAQFSVTNLLCYIETLVQVRVRNIWFAFFELTNQNMNSSVTFHSPVL